MKKGLSIALMVIAVVLLAASCASTPANQTPPWLNDFPPEDALWGIGAAKQSSLQMSRTTAEARARTSVARQLNTKVDAMFTDYMRDAGTVDNQTALSLQEDVSRQITSMQLNGARPTQQWQAPDGTFWIRVEYKISDAKTALTSVFTSEEASYAEFKTEEALRLLDAQLAKQEKPVPVSE
jgi:type IV pilus biogenesis protein CpaD/CtpE